MQAINATASGNTTAASANVTIASPVSAAAAPPMFAPATGPDTLTLALSETRRDVDAQFLATLDGVAIGGGVITAAHGASPSQVVSFVGNWGAGVHRLGVSIVNPAGNTSSAQALFVDAAAYDGTAITPATQVDGYNPTASFTVGSVANTIVLHMSEDAYLGDAQFIVSVDGSQVGGIRTVTALHGLGQSEAFTLAGQFNAGSHAVAVTFLNDAWGGPGAGLDRNLYVDSIDVNGTANPYVQANLYSSSTATLAVSGQAAAAGAPPSLSLTPLTPANPLTIFVPTTKVADTLVLYMSEDAYQGDAQFTVSVDGTQIGGVRSVTALHGQGRSEAFRLTGSFGAGSHTVAVNYLNDAYGGPGLDRNLYVDAASFNGVANLAAKSALYGAGIASLSVAGPAAAAATAADVISVVVSEDAYAGNAQFTISVDGAQIGGLYTATALHGQGQTQPVVITGNFGAGAHTVGVTFTNDAYGGNATLDRNLYVQSVSMDGNVSATAPASLYGNSTANFAVQGATSPVMATVDDTLVLHLSEDMFQGDAQFVVTVDGQSQGAAQSVTALHEQGQSQAFTFTGAFGVGPHDVAVSFINDAWGGPGAGLDRNLYVNSVDLNGTHYASATAALYGNGTEHLQIALTAGA